MSDKFKKAISDALTQEYLDYIPEAEDHIFSDKFEKKMNSLCSRRNKHHIILKRASCITAAAAAVFLVCMTPMQEVAGRKVPLENFHMHGNYKHQIITVDIREAEKAPKTLEEKYYLSEIPDGFKLDEEQTSITDAWISEMYFNENKDKCIIYKQDIKEGFILDHDYQHTKFETFIDEDDQEYLVCIIDDGSHTFIWDNGDYIFYLHANLPRDETFELVKSIKKVE